MGAPIGNQNSKDGKRSTRALEAAVEELSTGVVTEHCERFQFFKDYWKEVLQDGKEKKRLDVLMAASDRIEGRPTQKQELSTPDGPIEVKQWAIQPVKPSDPSTDS